MEGVARKISYPGINASRTISQVGSPLATTPSCGSPISMTSLDGAGVAFPNRIMSWLRTNWTRLGTSQVSQDTNLNGAMSRHWGWATAGRSHNSCQRGNLPCGMSGSIQWLYECSQLPVTKVLSQLQRGSIHNVRVQRAVSWMPLAQPVRGEMNQHELGAMLRRNTMKQHRGKGNTTQDTPYSWTWGMLQRIWRRQIPLYEPAEKPRI